MVLLILRHQQILNLGGTTDDEHQQASSHRVECAAMADFFELELTPANSDSIVRGHVRLFVNEQDTTRSIGVRVHVK